MKIILRNADIIQMRLVNQQIAETTYRQPQEIVNWMLAMQAQEYAMAKWAIGLRLPGSDDAAIENAFNSGAILRTHLLRPTWHFVTGTDIRWLLALTAPRVHAANAFMYRKMELNTSILKRSNDIFAKTLEGGKHLTRDLLNRALERKKIMADGVRLSCIMMYAELEGIICSGPRQGRQFTYALLDERVPHTAKITREEALNELVTRYFSSRGPATVPDFMVWSGLTMKEAKTGVAALGNKFVHETINGKEYLFASAAMAALKDNRRQFTFLMPDYDEYGMSYKDRTAIFNPEEMTSQIRGNNPVYNRMIVIDGKIAGSWQRVIKNNNVFIETVPFKTLSKIKQLALKKAIKKYTRFIGKEWEQQAP